MPYPFKCVHLCWVSGIRVQGIGYRVFLFNLGNLQPEATVKKKGQGKEKKRKRDKGQTQEEKK